MCFRRVSAVQFCVKQSLNAKISYSELEKLRLLPYSVRHGVGVEGGGSAHRKTSHNPKFY